MGIEENGDEELLVRIAALRASLDDLDYYELLDVDPEDGYDDIRDAYYRLAEQVHPDLHVGADEETRARVHAIFKRVNEAYTILGDPQRRKRYDEGLARGEKRLSLGRAVSRPEARKDDASSLVTPLGRQFHRLAMQELEKGNLQAARLNLKIAMSHEGASPFLEKCLHDLEARKKGGPA